MDFDVESRLQNVIISPALPIHEAISIMDRAGLGILLLCREDRQLTGILTDGDIRRAILRGDSLKKPCEAIATRDPICASGAVDTVDALYLMDHSRDYFVNQLPVVDEAGRVTNLILRRDLVKLELLPLSAVIMAGGAGSRLRPLTEDTPKPMLPVGNRPLMEIIIDQLRTSGIRRVNITTHYRAEKISEYFGDGHEHGVELNYVNEDTPLGTAGGLRLLGELSEPLLVINGDVLTRVDFRAMLSFHRRHDAALTVGVRSVTVQVPYGVVQCEGSFVRAVSEKPDVDYLVNAGVYLLEPDVYAYIPAGERFDMTDLINRLLAEGRAVVSYPIMEYWRDIGQVKDYEQVQRDVKDGRLGS